MLCECCEKQPISFECPDCIGEGAYKLCVECNSSIHRGKCRDHQVVTLASKKRQNVQETLEAFMKNETIVKRKFQELDKAEHDLVERMSIYEQEVKDKVQALTVMLRNQGKAIISELKELSGKKQSWILEQKQSQKSHILQMEQVRDKLASLVEVVDEEEFQKGMQDLDGKLNPLEFSCDKQAFPELDMSFELEFGQIEEAIPEMKVKMNAPKDEIPRTINKNGLIEVTVGETYTVQVANLMNPNGYFWVHPELEKEIYTGLLHVNYEIRCSWLTSSDWISYGDSSKVPEIDSLCFAQNEKDKRWYRGLVCKVSQEKSLALVRFLDFGNNAEIPLDKVFPFRDDIVSNLPYQAFCCSLSETSKEDLDRQIRWEFNDLVKNKLLQCKILSKVADDNGMPVYHAEFRFLNTQGVALPDCLNDLMENKIQEFQSKPKEEHTIACRDYRLVENPQAFDTMGSPGHSQDDDRPSAARRRTRGRTRQKTRQSARREQAAARQAELDEELSSSFDEPKKQASEEADKSVDIDSDTMMQAANDSVKRALETSGAKRKRGEYNYYSDELRAKIAKSALDVGIPRTVKIYSRELGKTISDSTVRHMKSTYLRLVAKAKDSTDVNTLPKGQRGQPLRLGNYDVMVQEWVKKTHASGGVVNARTVMAAAEGIITKFDKTSLSQYGGPINVTMSWAKSFLQRMGFVKHRGAKDNKKKPAKQLPEDFEAVRTSFIVGVRSCMQENNIPETLVINWDMIPLNLVPGNDWTVPQNDANSAPIIVNHSNHEDKRQISVMLAVTMSGCLLPPQVIYGGKTDKCHPNVNFPNGWHITHSENHEADETTLYQFVDNVIVPYVRHQRYVQGLVPDHPSLAVFDVNKPFRGDGLLERLRQHAIYVVFVPSQVADKLQPIDLTVVKHYKDDLRECFHTWYLQQMVKQLEQQMYHNGDQTVARMEAVNVDLRMNVLKPVHAMWLMAVHERTSQKVDVVRDGYLQAGLLHTPVTMTATIIHPHYQPVNIAPAGGQSMLMSHPVSHQQQQQQQQHHQQQHQQQQHPSPMHSPHPPVTHINTQHNANHMQQQQQQQHQQVLHQPPTHQTTHSQTNQIMHLNL